MKNYIKSTIDKIAVSMSKKSEASNIVIGSVNGSQVIPKEKSIIDCETSEEIIEVLSKIAETANLSFAYALKAQLQVIKYISSPEMIGSTFDLLFKNIKMSIELSDSKDEDFIKERAAYMLSNYIFFMKAKLEWEYESNREKIENQLVNATNEVAFNILSITGYACDISFGPNASEKLSKVLFDPKKENSSWYKNFKKLFFKNKQLREKTQKFLKSLDLLATKLENKFYLLGKNDIIAGMFENYREQLIELHSSEWKDYELKAKKCRKKSWIMAIVVFIISVLSLSIIFFVFVKSKPILSESFIIQSFNWLSHVSACIGISALILSLLVGVSYRIGGLKYKKTAKSIRAERCKYYDDIIKLYRETECKKKDTFQ